MIDKYENYFEARYKLFFNDGGKYRRSSEDRFFLNNYFTTNPLFFPITGQNIGQIIEDQTRRTRLKWRSDAKLFLGINVFENVILPILYISDQSLPDGEPFSKIVTDETLFSIIESDIKSVVISTEKVAKSRNRNYVSGTSTLIGLSKVVDKLKSTEMRIWGESKIEEEPKEF